MSHLQCFEVSEGESHFFNSLMFFYVFLGLFAKTTDCLDLLGSCQTSQLVKGTKYLSDLSLMEFISSMLARAAAAGRIKPPSP